TVKTGSFSDWTASDANNMLPVKFRTFTAKENIDGSASIKWITSEEINNEGFEVEKSSDGKSFEKIGFVNGSGNATSDKSYEFSDNMFTSKAYYRLRQVDFNGESEYSAIIHLDKKGMSAQKPFAVSPNPMKDHATISSTIPDISGKSIEVVIFSAKGKEMMRKSGTLDEINEELNNAVAPWDEGIYIIDIRFNGKVERLKILKDRL
ncbi:MAG: T9SS type A sorting domain-containing protein, partial [Candidatus Caenarcaniphilales bacterium]|nr:T9SS type A sorting domain-containing protein [Candidatus Caenarcaniphilales bacterium]